MTAQQMFAIATVETRRTGDGAWLVNITRPGQLLIVHSNEYRSRLAKLCRERFGIEI
jgi:hypothetical protein